FPVGFAVVIAVIRGVPHDDLAVIYYRKIDRKAVIMIGLSTFGVGHDIAVLRSALCIKCILFLICAEAICNLYRNIFFCSFFFYYICFFSDFWMGRIRLRFFFWVLFIYLF